MLRLQLCRINPRQYLITAASPCKEILIKAFANKVSIRPELYHVCFCKSRPGYLPHEQLFSFGAQRCIFLLCFEQVTLLQSHLHTLVGFMRLRLQEQVNAMPANHAECAQHDFTEIYSCWHLVFAAKRLQENFKGLLQIQYNL